jgi:hypothetical protein
MDNYRLLALNLAAIAPKTNIHPTTGVDSKADRHKRTAQAFTIYRVLFGHQALRVEKGSKKTAMVVKSRQSTCQMADWVYNGGWVASQG